MADVAHKPSEYLHAFTLYQDPKKGKDTSPKARKAYTDALEAKGFKPVAPNRDGNLTHLPGATMVGTFASDDAAIAAVKEAEIEAEAADTGKFFRESAVLTPYRRLRVVGPRATTPATTKPAAGARPSQASGILDAIVNPKDPKRR